MNFFPALMKMNDGRDAVTAQDMRERREEMLEILKENAYGDMPAPVPVKGTVLEEIPKCAAGKAMLYNIEIACDFGDKSFTFPLKLFMPHGEGKRKLITVINFTANPYDKYIPSEEIIDNGFALAYIYYEDITADNGDFGDKLAAFYPRTGSGREPAKISMWAWSVSRALDYLTTRDDVDADNLAVMGHSRLGKTALWCAANDERVKFACSNDSGCMGAAYHRTLHEGGEPLSSITQVFPFWFCGNLQKYRDDTSALPFDQHFLLACIAPRYVLINSASLNDWADPYSEQLTCLGASPAWHAYGKDGYKGGESEYGADEGSLYGEVAYFKRYGVHFLGRQDWQNLMFVIKHNT